MQRTSPRFAANEGSRPDYRAANTHGFHHLPPVVEVVEEAAALPSPNQHSKVGEEVQPARVPGEHHEAVACDGKSTRGAAAAARTAPNHRAVMWMTTRICATPTTRRRIGSRVPSLG
jgi:hypothetical protein